MPPREAVLLFLAAVLLPCAAAQAAAASPPSGAYTYGDFNPSMAIIIVVLVSAFFFMGFFTIYIRHCVEVTGYGAPPRFYASVHLRLNDRGLDPEIIDSFPIFHYSDVKEHKLGKGALECAVCICEFEDDEALRLLPKCDHVFHPECIDAWLSSHATCPVCRANLKPTPEETAGNDQVESIHAAAAEEQNPGSEIGETQNQISITIDEDQGRDPEAVETPTPTPTPKQSRQGGVKFPRSHSTGHSLVQPGECCERYTLRLPEELRTQILSRRLKRTTSCTIVLPAEGSTRRGNRYGGGGGEGSNRGRLPEWLTPPFLSRNRGFMSSPKRVFDGEVTSLGPSKLCLASVITPFDCLAPKGDGVGQTSLSPPV